MTIEEVLGWDASKLEALTDEDLKKHFDHYLIVTRPEHAPRQIKQEQRVMELNPKLAQAIQIGKSLGIAIPTFKTIGKRKS